MNFKVGDKIKVVIPKEFDYLKDTCQMFDPEEFRVLGREGKIAKIVNDAIAVDFGDSFSGHDCGGSIDSKTGRWFYIRNENQILGLNVDLVGYINQLNKSDITGGQSVLMLKKASDQLEFEF